MCMVYGDVFGQHHQWGTRTCSCLALAARCSCMLSDMAPAGVRLQQPVVSEARAAGERASATCQRTTQLRRLIHPPNLTPTLSTLHPTQGRILRAAFCCFVPGYSGGPRRLPVGPAHTPLPHAHKPWTHRVSVCAAGFLLGVGKVVLSPVCD